MESCKNNPSVNWLIYTDDKTKYNYPDNVMVKYTTFEEIKNKFQEKLSFKIALDRPYKLCDFKPAYGLVFEENLKQYDYWGYCDIDLFFGDIRKFFTDEILNKYDKIGFYGHCTLFKNNAKVNNLFKSNKRYKDVFTNEKNLGFDEEYHKNTINDIFLENKMKCLFHEYQANLFDGTSNFKLTKFDFDTNNYFIEEKQSAFFIYDHGKLLRYYTYKDQIDEYLYLHMQTRPMKIRTENLEFYKIIPNSFDDISYEELKNPSEVKIKHRNLQYFRRKIIITRERIKKKIEALKQ